MTMEEPNATKPKPLEFEVSAGGVSWIRTALGGAPAIIASKPPRAG